MAALVLATAGTLCGNSRVISAWRLCMGQDHEPDPRLLTATVSAWVVMLAVLLMIGALPGPLPGNRWYLWLAMLFGTAALTCLYVYGMTPSVPLQAGDPSDAACGTMPAFPFTG